MVEHALGISLLRREEAEPPNLHRAIMKTKVQVSPTSRSSNPKSDLSHLRRTVLNSRLYQGNKLESPLPRVYPNKYQR